MQGVNTNTPKDTRDLRVHQNVSGQQSGYHAMLARLAAGAFALSIEVKASGTRYWISAPNPRTLVRLVARLDPPPPGVDRLDPQYGYEVINPDAPICLYLDIEDERPTRDNALLWSKTLAIMSETLCETFGDAINVQHITIDATNENKLSKHVIYPNVVFDNLLSMKSFMLKVTHKIDHVAGWECLQWRNDVKTGKDRVYPWVIDTSVLSRYRCFRLPLCRKRKANSTPLTIDPSNSTYVFPTTDLVDRVLESTCQWRLHIPHSADPIIRSIAQPACANVSMAASGRKNPFTSIPISISSENWTDNIYLKTAWAAIEGERWWARNKKSVRTENNKDITIHIYVDEGVPVFCPLKCYYNKYVAYRRRQHGAPVFLRWQPDGTVALEDCHDGNANVKLTISAYTLVGVDYLSVASYCFRGCYSFLRNLGWNAKLKERIPFPKVKPSEGKSDYAKSATDNNPMQTDIEQYVHAAEQQQH